MRRLQSEAIAFLVRGGHPKELIRKDHELLRAVVRLLVEDAPIEMAVHDPVLYRALRARITDLRTEGWGVWPHLAGRKGKEAGGDEAVMG